MRFEQVKLRAVGRLWRGAANVLGCFVIELQPVLPSARLHIPYGGAQLLWPLNQDLF
jgi:hypothetical protein